MFPHLAIISSLAQKLVTAMLTAWLTTHALRIATAPLNASYRSKPRLSTRNDTIAKSVAMDYRKKY